MTDKEFKAADRRIRRAIKKAKATTRFTSVGEAFSYMHWHRGNTADPEAVKEFHVWEEIGFMQEELNDESL